MDLFIKKISEADNRLIYCKDVNKIGDLKENKTKVNNEIKETSKTIQSILQRN